MTGVRHLEWSWPRAVQLLCGAMLLWTCAGQTVGAAPSDDVVSSNNSIDTVANSITSTTAAALGHTSTSSATEESADVTTKNPFSHMSSTATTTTTTAFAGCGAVATCLEDANCAQCLSTVNLTAVFGHSHDMDIQTFATGSSARRTYGVEFFQTLVSTPACSISATSPSVMHAALQELDDVTSCENSHGIFSIGNCILPEYACFVDPDCRTCLATLYSSDVSNETKIAILNSTACLAASSTLLQDLALVCPSFPVCSFYKQQCLSWPECARCMATLGSGDGAEAARQCHGTGPMGIAIANVANTCFGTSAVSCSFWQQLCASNVNCSGCLANMGNGNSARVLADDWNTLRCHMAVNDFVAVSIMGFMSSHCPGTSTCRFAVTHCVYASAETCIACLNGSAPPGQATQCALLSEFYSLNTACQSCPASVQSINMVVFATASVGSASAVACLMVAATVLAYGRDRVSMRDRIVVGLMMSNAVYSSANAIPLNALHTGVIDCGRLTMSFVAIRFGRAWWFCGKYGLVSFELLILGASIRAMLFPASAVPLRAEAAMHAACCGVAALAFAVFFALCVGINADGYNTSTIDEVYTSSYNHASATDDLDDDAAASVASSKFQRGRNEYDNLVRDMLIAWDVLVGVAVVLWIVLRMMARNAVQALHTIAVAAARDEAADVWADTRRGAWRARQQVLQARQDAFAEVAKPLEPYIAVFVLFSPPAFVMSTSFCQRHSGASAMAADTSGYAEYTGSATVSYGTCDVWCEFVLAFRSLCTVAVYLVPRERRSELLAVRTTWRKLRTRWIEWICCSTRAQYVPLGHNDNDEFEMNSLEHQQLANDDTNASWHIHAFNIIKGQRLGEGAYGEVWDGTLLPERRRVAIKILFAGAVDEDGDLVDPNADEDFQKECAALKRVDSPHLIRFFGFGTTLEGNGFIVTELMSGGSLEDVLHDIGYDLQWQLRVKLGLQVALGMEHLHARHLLHRDLKSANVLLNEQRTIAKVCDFGLSRVVRPARRQIVHSPFTGVTRLLPQSTVMNDGRQSASALWMTDIGVSIEDARGTMTKAAGTLQWMAPEVFRGDHNYTKAVDVYSFGMVLWELATRKVPWKDDIEDSETATSLFNGINHALQTGSRPTIPDAVLAEHGAFVAVMQRCWAGDPTDRPSFSEAASDLAACLGAPIYE